jgi:hypothetical protein
LQLADAPWRSQRKTEHLRVANKHLRRTRHLRADALLRRRCSVCNSQVLSCKSQMLRFPHLHNPQEEIRRFWLMLSCNVGDAQAAHVDAQRRHRRCSSAVPDAHLRSQLLSCGVAFADAQLRPEMPTRESAPEQLRPQLLSCVLADAQLGCKCSAVRAFSSGSGCTSPRSRSPSATRQAPPKRRDD